MEIRLICARKLDMFDLISHNLICIKAACLEREKQAGAIEDMKQLDEYYKVCEFVHG